MTFERLKIIIISTINRYNAERVLGSGSFGIVYQAQVVETNETVAIKKVFQDKRYKNRELQIMKELKLIDSSARIFREPE